MKEKLDDWQFRLSLHPLPNATRIGQHFLQTGDGLNEIPIKDASGVSVGVLLGFPIDIARKEMIHGSYVAPRSLAENTDSFVEDVLEELGGRFLWIFAANNVSRIYVDCSAQVPCVYDRDHQLVGSTANAILDKEEYKQRLDHELHNFLGVEKEGWFPGGLTAHIGIERVLPNHYLDLSTFKIKRHWPLDDINTTSDPHGNILKLVELVQKQIEAVVKEPKRAGLALTAGRETRMLLACARLMLKDIDFITVVGTDRHATDTVIAKKIAKDLSLNHIELPRKIAQPDQTLRYIRRGGHCVGDTNALYHPSVWPIAESHILVGGLGGEISRAFLWKKSDTAEMSLDAEKLIHRLGLPSHPRIKTAVHKWILELSDNNAFRVLDLAYIEHRMGPWYGAQFYSDPKLVRLAPLMTRQAVRLMLQLPDEWKKSQRMCDAVLQQSWPELLQYPFNSIGMIRNFLIRAQKVYDNPSIILKKLRKLR